VKKLVVVICFLLLFTGCLSAAKTNAPVPPVDPGVIVDNPAPQDEKPDDSVPVDPAPNGQEEIDLAAVRPNELGKVMVLMYHEVGNKEDTWARHKDNFRRDMETLYTEGYRPVNLNDYLAGNIDLPAGTTPFILTFDDGTAGQFRLVEVNGELVVDPDSAVGILIDLNKKYPDFKLAGTFYIYYPLPFRQKEYIRQKLETLISLGFEIGNHTYNHENLGKVSMEEGIRALARHVKTTEEYLPGYKVNTLALPYGVRPREDSHLLYGEWEGISYVNNAVLLVGANPAFSPFDNRFNPSKLPRIRADEVELYRWLAYFTNNPDERFISDGNPDIVTVPATVESRLDLSKLDNLELRVYDLSLLSD